MVADFATQELFVARTTVLGFVHGTQQIALPTALVLQYPSRRACAASAAS
jgi:hypothetical protein